MGRSLLAATRSGRLFAALVVITALSACPRVDEFHLEIFGDETSIGADVVVDSKKLGTMDIVAGTAGGEPGAHLSAWLPNGAHTLEFRKQRFATLVMEIDVPTARDHYIFVRLKSFGEKVSIPNE